MPTEESIVVRRCPECNAPYPSHGKGCSFWKTKDLSSLPQKAEYEIQATQAQALVTLAKATSDIAAFLTGGGLSQLVSGYARSQSAQAILGGLAAHDGRDALDARVLGQNALEIVKQVGLMFDKFEQDLKAKDKVDPEVKDGEADFKKWKESKPT